MEHLWSDCLHIVTWHNSSPFLFLIHPLVLVSQEQAGLLLYQALPSKTWCVFPSHCILLAHLTSLSLSFTAFPSLHWLTCFEPRLADPFVAGCVFGAASHRSGGTCTAPFSVASSQNWNKCVPAGWSSYWASKRRKEQIPHYPHLWRTLVSTETREREKRVLLHWVKTAAGWGKTVGCYMTMSCLYLAATWLSCQYIIVSEFAELLEDLYKFSHWAHRGSIVKLRSNWQTDDDDVDEDGQDSAAQCRSHDSYVYMDTNNWNKILIKIENASSRHVNWKILIPHGLFSKKCVVVGKRWLLKRKRVLNKQVILFGLMHNLYIYLECT